MLDDIPGSGHDSPPQNITEKGDVASGRRELEEGYLQNAFLSKKKEEENSHL